MVAIAEWLKDQKPEIQEMAKKDPKGLKKLLMRQIILRKKKYPCHSVIPNIAQRRALVPYEKPNPKTGDYVTYLVFTGGNGVGKTCIMSWIVCGVSQGNKYLNPKFFHHQYFDDCEKIRKKRPFALRIICANADMENNGSVYQQISKWVPTAKFSGMTSGGYYTKITIPAPEKGYHDTVIDIKTHDMDIVKFSGSDCDLILLNEPLKDEKKFDECVGRLRMGGRIGMFLTPDDGVAYLQKMINNPLNKDILAHIEGSIWDNCKDIPGTDGVLSKQKIETLIAKWRSNPVTFLARTEGKFTHLAGAVYQLYNKEIHTCEPFEIPSNWMVMQIVDPHLSKPAVSVWMAISPLNIWYVIAEYPYEPWDEITGNIKTIKMIGYDFKLIEAGKVKQFGYLKGMPKIRKEKRIGDPNMFKTPLPQNNKTMQWEYKEHTGFYYYTDVDDDIALRHDKIMDLIYYDPTKEISSINTPRIQVFNTCNNVQNAFVNYCLKEDGKPEKEWKCWMDCVGYGVVTFDCWEHQSPIYGGHNEEGEAIRNSTKGVICDRHKSPYGVHMEVAA